MAWARCELAALRNRLESKAVELSRRLFSHRLFQKDRARAIEIHYGRAHRWRCLFRRGFQDLPAGRVVPGR